MCFDIMHRWLKWTLLIVLDLIITSPTLSRYLVCLFRFKIVGFIHQILIKTVKTNNAFIKILVKATVQYQYFDMSVQRNYNWAKMQKIILIFK
jgi:hypothetical protein